MKTSGEVFAPHPRLAARLIGGRALILDPHTEELRRLNDTGSFIWDRVTRRSFDRDALLEAVVAEFEVDRETAAADLDALLAAFEDESLVVRIPRP